MIVARMAVTESNTACGPTTTSDLHNTNSASTNQSALLKPKNVSIRSYSEIDRILDASETGDESGHSETEAYDHDTLEPATSPPAADFIVDLSKLTTEEVASLLKSTKENGEKRRTERANRIRQMQQKLKSVEDKLKRKIGMAGMAPYREAIKTDMPLPTYVTTNQTQLCRAFHVHEVYLNQTKRMQKKNKKLLSFLSRQIKLLQEQNQLRETLLREKVDDTRTQVVHMCSVLEINPDDWKRPGENELIRRVSEALSGVPLLGDWARSFSEGSTRSLSQAST